MKVELVAYSQPFCGFDEPAWGNPLKIVEQCASVCYDSKPTEDCRIAKSCKDSGHLSVLEHISFTFHISGVSRSLLAQLSRHRHISLSVQSQRYCDLNDQEMYEQYGCCFGYVQPKLTDGFEKTRFIRAMQDSSKWYLELLECGTPKEDARAVLPNACCTELYMTANARALIEMSYLRLCNRAQHEIRTMFEEIKKQVAIVVPEVAEWMVPQCEKNNEYPFCTEKKSCGRHKTLKEVYDGISSN